MAGLIATPEPTFLSITDRLDLVQDAERNLLYISTKRGDVLRYDLANHSFLTPFQFPGQPAGLDLSPNQDKLAVADLEMNGVHVVDLATGTTQDYFFGSSRTSISVAFEDNQTLVVSNGNLVELNLASGVFKPFGGTFDANWAAVGADRSVIGYTGPYSRGPFGLVRASDERVTSGELDVGVDKIAISRDGSQLALPTYEGTYILNSSLQQLGRVGEYGKDIPLGAVYSPHSDIVYFAWHYHQPDGEHHARIEAYNSMTLTRINAIDGGPVLPRKGNELIDNGYLKIAQDGSQLYATVPGGLNIYELSAAPFLGGITGGAYVENGAALVFGGDPTVTDADSANFAGGQFAVAITANANPQDELSIRQTGTGPGQISVSASDVLYSGVSIGAFAGGTGSTPLIVQLNSSATPEAVQALARNITFRNTGEAPGASVRKVAFQLSDDRGNVSELRTTTVQVTDINDRPVLKLSGTVFAPEGADTVMAPNAMFVDDNPDLYNGRVTVTIANGGSADDRLRVKSTSELVVSNGKAYYQNFEIGPVSGGVGTDPLVVAIIQAASPQAVQALIRSISIGTVSDFPDNALRTVTYVVDDGAGLQSDPATATKYVKLKNVNDAPVLSFTGNGNPVYTENGAPVTLVPDATATDVDNANFAQGHLSVSTIVGFTPNDRLRIRNDGTAAGQIGTDGQNVLFGGEVIGEFWGGGPAGKPLFVYFNANCTPEAAQALARAVTFHVAGENPGAHTRWVNFELTDGVRGKSSRIRFVDVAAVDDPMQLVASGSVGYRLGASPLAFVPNAWVREPDAAYIPGAVLTVHSEGADSGDLIGLSGVFDIADDQVSFGGTIIGSRNSAGGSGSTDLVITLNASANRAIFQSLLRSLTFQASATAGKRTLSISVIDGNSLASNTVTKFINVS